MLRCPTATFEKLICSFQRAFVTGGRGHKLQVMPTTTPGPTQCMPPAPGIRLFARQRTTSTRATAADERRTGEQAYPDDANAACSLLHVCCKVLGSTCVFHGSAVRGSCLLPCALLIYINCFDGRKVRGRRFSTDASSEGRPHRVFTCCKAKPRNMRSHSFGADVRWNATVFDTFHMVKPPTSTGISTLRYRQAQPTAEGWLHGETGPGPTTLIGSQDG